ncbi:hypothetical protein GCM10009001_31470 [Virgibacillus siamensis]|uniref:Uncharacterized protein n=1 Tax=Virgibacillus siamensis TaxID=480071 RepID=A0ABP3RPR9_9BACI
MLSKMKYPFHVELESDKIKSGRPVAFNFAQELLKSALTLLNSCLLICSALLYTFYK